jgi:zinc/manganese transport system permease protein
MSQKPNARITTMINDLTTYLSYGFVQNALIAGTLSAVLGAIIGYFVIIRNAGFAAHALAHIGFAGATGAAIFSLSPLEGMLLLTIGSGLFMGATGDKVSRSDLAIGMVLSMSLGLGTLFLSFYKGYTGLAKSILFGAVFGVSGSQIVEMIALSLLCLVALAIISRRLLFVSVQPRLAEARGLSLSGHSMAFMTILATAVSMASQVVGILLVFTLIIAPAGIALRVCRRFWTGILTSVILGVAVVWIGILLDCATNYPATFWITGIFFIIYLLVEAYVRWFTKMDR